MSKSQEKKALTTLLLELVLLVGVSWCLRQGGCWQLVGPSWCHRDKIRSACHRADSQDALIILSGDKGKEGMEVARCGDLGEGENMVFSGSIQERDALKRYVQVDPNTSQARLHAELRQGLGVSQVPPLPLTYGPDADMRG